MPVTALTLQADRFVDIYTYVRMGKIQGLADDMGHQRAWFVLR